MEKNTISSNGVGSGWSSLISKFKDSVMQIYSVKSVYNPFRPQNQPDDVKVSGTGFIISIKDGLIMTNAHVIVGAVYVSGRLPSFGGRDFVLNVVSLCTEKDVAICQLSEKDINDIIGMGKKKLEDINMHFGDNLKLYETQTVCVLGYPMGQKNIKATTGIISGFHGNNTDDDNDGRALTEEEYPSYIQMTAPTNPGNSGGPVITEDGLVIGIASAGYMMSQNIAFAIGTRTIFAIIDDLLAPVGNRNISRPHVVMTPKYGFEYSRATSSLLELSCGGSKSVGGLYVKNVYPNSCLDKLKEGDIITEISYKDRFATTKSFSITEPILENTRRTRDVIATVDEFGGLDVNIICENELACRKISVKELFDMMPSGEQFSVKICRIPGGEICKSGEQCGEYRITTRFIYLPSTFRSIVYPNITPFKYMILSGISIGELTINHIIASNADLFGYIKGKKRFKEALVVNQVFPDTEAYSSGIFKEGTIITKINGVPVAKIEDIKNVLGKEWSYLTITTKEKDKFVVKRSTVELEGKKVSEIINRNRMN